MCVILAHETQKKEDKVEKERLVAAQAPWGGGEIPRTKEKIVYAVLPAFLNALNPAPAQRLSRPSSVDTTLSDEDNRREKYGEDTIWRR